MSLYDTFASALLTPDLPCPEGLFSSNGADPASRFAVYRNNVHNGLINALATAYPVTLQLVGDDFFRAMARLYVQACPPTSPMISEYGSGFARFIQGFDPAARVPYLADVARLERLRVRAYHAADTPPLEQHALIHTLSGQTDLGQLRLQQAPLAVVVVAGDLAEGIGDLHQVAALVVGEARRVAGAVDLLGELAEGVPAQGLALAAGVDDLHRQAAGVIAVAGDMAQRVDLSDAVAALVVAVLPGIAGGVGLGFGQRPVAEPLGEVTAPQRVEGFAEVAGFVIGKLPTRAVRGDGGQQLAFVVPVEQPELAEGVTVAGDLVLAVPVAFAGAAKAISDPGDARVQIVMQLVFVSIVGPVPCHPPYGRSCH